MELLIAGEGIRKAEGRGVGAVDKNGTAVQQCSANSHSQPMRQPDTRPGERQRRLRVSQRTKRGVQYS
jgi:hypothetical protein